jgi:plasmid stabilization system protein ParE
MPQHVFYSRQGRNDLLEIENFIAARDGELRAEAVVSRIQRTLDRLAFMPNAGRVRSDLLGSPHTFLVQSWRIFYRPRTKLDGILVIRILDTRRDIDAILRKRSRRHPKVIS